MEHRLRATYPEAKRRVRSLAKEEVVSAGVILIHFVEVKLTHLGDDGGLLAAEDAYPEASSGDQSEMFHQSV